MGRNLSKEYKLQSNKQFAEIIKKAYEIGRSDGTITVEKLIEEIRSELIKMKIG